MESSKVYFWFVSTVKTSRYCWTPHTQTHPRLGNAFVTRHSPDDAKWHAAQCSDNNQRLQSRFTVSSEIQIIPLKIYSTRHLHFTAQNIYIYIIHIKLVAIAAKSLHCLLSDRGTTIRQKPSESTTHEIGLSGKKKNYDSKNPCRVRTIQEAEKQLGD